MRLSGLIFDVDGTLADTEEAHRCAFNEAFEQLRLGWNWSKPEYARLLLTTGGKERLAAYITSLPLPQTELDALTSRIGEIHRAKTANYTRKVLAGGIPLRDGVERLLDEAARCGVRLGIATTTTMANIEALLRTNLGADALKRFAVIGAGDHAARKKPAPDIYDYVLHHLNAAPRECVAIEDSANGLRSAKAAGLFTIVTPSYWTEAEDFSAADLLLPSLGSIGIRDIERRLDAT